MVERESDISYGGKEYEDTRPKKDRQYNSQKKDIKTTNNDIQNTTQKTKDNTNPTKTRGRTQDPSFFFMRW